MIILRRKKNMKENKNKKKLLLTIALASLLAVGGTTAWLSRESSLTNTFTVGDIRPIDPGENGPEQPDIPDEDKEDETKLKDYLYEPEWKHESKIIPGATIPKNPYVGIGPDSEEAYVFVYVENNMKNVYFDVNENWTDIAGDKYMKGTDDTGHYVSGLFMYKVSDTEKTLVPAEGKNVWTKTPLFDEVIADESATADDLTTEGATVEDTTKEAGTIVVHSFVHQAKDSAGASLETEAIAAARAAFAKK